MPQGPLSSFSPVASLLPAPTFLCISSAFSLMMVTLLSSTWVCAPLCCCLEHQVSGRNIDEWITMCWSGMSIIIILLFLIYVLFSFSYPFFHALTLATRLTSYCHSHSTGVIHRFHNMYRPRVYPCSMRHLYPRLIRETSGLRRGSPRLDGVEAVCLFVFAFKFHLVPTFHVCWMH
jgi:hypothetical protein